MNSFADEVTRGFEDALASHGAAPLKRLAERHPGLSGLSARDLVAAAVSDRTDPLRRDQLWLAIIEAYHQGPRPFWGPVLLKAVLPTLLRKARRLHDRDLGEDIGHQLVAAVLDAALSQKLTVPARWTPNRLATRAATKTRRWMAAETGARCLYLNELPETPARPDPEPGAYSSFFDRLRALGLNDRASLLLYRNRILGEPLSGLALQLGTTEAALQMRRLRAEERIRRQLAA